MVKYKITDKLDRVVEDSRSFTVTPPVFEWAMAENAGDIFAKYAYLRVKAKDADKVTFYHNGSQLTDLIPLGQEENGVVSFVWNNLTAGQSYSNKMCIRDREKGEKVTITGDADYPAMLRVKGGRINDRLSAIRKEMAPLLKEQADLIRQLNKKNRENLNSSIEEADMASRLANVNHLLSEEAAAAIKKYPDEEASVVLIQHYFNHPDDTRQMDELLAVLNPKLNDFYLVRKLQEYSTRAKRTASVSYTHLDVYKRQVYYGRTDKSNNSGKGCHPFFGRFR